MAELTGTTDIITDPHTLQGVSRLLAKHLNLAEPLRLLFIDKSMGRFAFGFSDEASRRRADLQLRPALEEALREIFEEEVLVELVIFQEEEGALPALIRELAPLAAPAVAEAPKASNGSAEPTRLQALQLSFIESSLRGVFTSPRRVVVVPGYLVRWVPYLGPLRASLIAACFQAYYLCHRTTAKANQTFEAPGPFLAALAGVAESSVWRHLDDRELTWFLKKVPYKPGEKRWVRDERAGLTKKLPTRFLFRSTTPLTPGDAQALATYLSDLNSQENPVAVLSDLVRGEYRVEPRDVFPFPAPPPPPDWSQADPEACLIQNVIYAATGIEPKAATKELAGLVDELVERLLPPSDQLHLSWYFLLHWLPLLGHGPGWAAILLRDRCYYNRQTGELRDTVSLRGGYQELAAALGLQRLKTLREWFPAPNGQKQEMENSDLSSVKALEQIALSKRGFVRQYAARFVEIIEAEADGRGQVASFKAQVQLFDPLTPAHQAIYNALYPLALGYFSLPQVQQTAFLGGFEAAAALEERAAGQIRRATNAAAEILFEKYGLAQKDDSLPTGLLTEFLGAIKQITESNLGANRRIAEEYPGAIERVIPEDLDANERITPVDLGADKSQGAGDPGAVGSITPQDLGAFERFARLLSGALGGITYTDPGAVEKLGLVFWAQMRGLKYLVLNHRLDEALKEYFQNTDLQNTKDITSTTNTDALEDDDWGEASGVGVERSPEIKQWDLNRLLENFSPPVKRSLLEKEVCLEAVLSCLFYIASSKGDNLGLGYVVEKLKSNPKDGQGGIYLRIASEAPAASLARLRGYLDSHSFQDRDWRLAMGSPSTDKILELLEHLGLDSAKFAPRFP